MLKKLYTRGLRFFRRALYMRVTDVIEQIQLGTANDAEAPYDTFQLPEHLTVRRFDAKDTSLALQLNSALFQDFTRRSKHSTGYILWHGSSMAGYLWATDQALSKEGEPPFLYDIKPPPHALYLYDLQILPHCRLKGAGTALMTAALKNAELAGKENVFATRASWNQPMASLFRKLGFKETGQIEFKRILGIGHRDLRALYA